MKLWPGCSYLLLFLLMASCGDRPEKMAQERCFEVPLDLACGPQGCGQVLTVLNRGSQAHLTQMKYQSGSMICSTLSERVSPFARLKVQDEEHVFVFNDGLVHSVQLYNLKEGGLQEFAFKDLSYVQDAWFDPRGAIWAVAANSNQLTMIHHPSLKREHIDLSALADEDGFAELAQIIPYQGSLLVVAQNIHRLSATQWHPKKRSQLALVNPHTKVVEDVISIPVANPLGVWEQGGGLQIIGRGHLGVDSLERHSCQLTMQGRGLLSDLQEWEDPLLSFAKDRKDHDYAIYWDKNGHENCLMVNRTKVQCAAGDYVLKQVEPLWRGYLLIKREGLQEYIEAYDEGHRLRKRQLVPGTVSDLRWVAP